jgi:hypothetical protein
VAAVRRALVAGALAAAAGTLGAWLVAISAISSTPPPAVRVYGEPAAGERWFRVAAFDAAHRKIVPVEGTLGFGGRLTRIDAEHANVTLGPGRTPIEADVVVDERRVRFDIEGEITQACAANELEHTPWTRAVMSGPEGPPLYPEGGLVSSARASRVLVLKETGVEHVDVPANAAGARLADGRLLRPGRGAIEVKVERSGDTWTVRLEQPAFLEVRRDGCVREMGFGETLSFGRGSERWRSVHVFGSRFADEGTSVFLPPDGAPREIAAELLEGPAAGDPLLAAIAAGKVEAADEALGFALARLSWRRGRAPRIGPDDAAQRAAWRDSQSGLVSQSRWAMRGLALLSALLLVLWSLRGARQPGQGQGRSIAIGVFLLVIALAALGALDWSISLSAK